MKRGGLLIALLVLLTGASALIVSVQLESFVVSEVDDDFVITWKATSEEGLRHYVLLRKTPYSNGQYVMLEEVVPLGAGRQYHYRDSEIYKSAAEQVSYRLDAVYQNSHEVLATESVEYRPTAVRRTWGSIKAMFQ